MSSGVGSLPGSPVLRAAVLRRLSDVADQLESLADVVLGLGLALESAGESNPGVDSEVWAAYVDQECRDMLGIPE